MSSPVFLVANEWATKVWIEMNDPPNDNSVVKTSITIKYVKSWFKKILPVLQLAVFSIRTIALVCGIPLPSLPAFIPGSDEVMEQMETMLLDINDKALDEIKEWIDKCQDANKLTEFLSEHEPEISAEAYGALAIEAYKPQHLRWQDDMVIANEGDCYAWVKKANKQDWIDHMKGVQQASA
jgi:hypothetical protein